MPGYGSDLYGTGVYSAAPVSSTPADIRSVRELPPLRHSVEVRTPANRYFRWGIDERNPANVPVGLRHSDTMPGGYETLDVTLARQPARDYPDLDRLSTIQVRDAGGDVVGEYRLERTPRVSGDQMAISPSAVGWQAALDDDKSASFVGIDRDASHWRGPSSERMIALMAAGSPMSGPESRSSVDGLPGLELRVDGAITTLGQSEAWYDAGPGNLVSGVYLSRPALVNMSGASWTEAFDLNTVDTAIGGTTLLAATQADTLPTGVTAYVSGSASARFLRVRIAFSGTTASTVQRARQYAQIAVVGNHGLTLTGSTGAEGLLASDIVKYAVARWAPTLRVSSETVTTSNFAIEHFVQADPASAAEIVRQATRFGLEDWAVWANKTFYWYPRGELARNWRARVGPSGLEETGPQIDRVWESIVVQYQDVDGTTRTVGPPGSGTDTESSALKDSDPDNPANQLGIIRRDLLSMGVGTAASATEVGRRFLEQTKLLDTSGRARIVGHVENDRGVRFPFSSMRAGDTLTFIDAADTSPRRIVRTEKDYSSRSCSVDLDAPPEGLSALLERLGVVLVPLGL